MDFNSEKFSYQLLSLMEEFNMSQKALAQKIGTSNVTISRYISGERTPRLDVIIKIANVFNVSTDYLLGSNVDRKQISKSGNINVDISDITCELYALQENHHLSQKQIELVKKILLANKDFILSA